MGAPLSVVSVSQIATARGDARYYPTGSAGVEPTVAHFDGCPIEGREAYFGAMTSTLQAELQPSRSSLLPSSHSS